uniref:DNA gyrase subunit B n=1 Tax=Anthurium amnicola TaxID=1678845 RepID=A0A1D1YG26_9ARAE
MLRLRADGGRHPSPDRLPCLPPPARQRLLFSGAPGTRSTGECCQAGISEEELTIIERHTACSLSQQKASARFYLMRYLGTSNDKVTEFSVKDLVDSLRGPLFSKDLTVKPVVEYFHLLPYADILSDWLSRQQSVGGLPSSLEQQGNLGENVQAGRTPIEEFEVSDRSFSTAGAEEILDKKASDNDGIINMKEHDLSCMIRSSGSACIPQKVDKDISLKYPHLMTLSKDETQALENATENKHVEEGGKFLVVNDSLLHGDGFKDEVDLDGLIKKPSIIEFTDSRQSSRSDVCNIVFSGQGGEIVTDLPLVPMSNNPQIPDKFQLASMSFDLQCGGKFQAVLESKKRDLLVASSRVLQRKREELHHQRRLLEDEIAQCEMNLQRVLNEEEENLMLKFDSIIEACNSLCSSQVCTGKLSSYRDQSRPQNTKRRRLSEAVLSLRSPCQELDDICCENNWILPRYNILPSFNHGGYRASVTVQGPDFECKGDGDLCSNPQEAREAAATKILNQLRSMASQAR